MFEPKPKTPSQIPSALRLLSYMLVIFLLACGGFYLWFYLSINAEYIRADFVASQAQRQVTQLYEQIRGLAPTGAVLISEKRPQSGSYAWGLSDGSPRYGYVRSHQVYNLNADFNDILAAYDHILAEWGWKTLAQDDVAGTRVNLFHHSPDEKLLIGLCQLSDAPAHQTQYTIFFDFDEGVGCGEYCPNPLCCVTERYCESQE